MNSENSGLEGGYFTEDKKQQIREMTDDVMQNLLVEFENTQYWIAYIKYVNARLGFAQTGVNTGDPFKEPTSIARNQGVMMGLVDPQNAVISLVSARTRETRKIAEENGQEI